jgi:hypothetical protein
VVLAFYGGLFLLTVLRVSRLPRTSELTDINNYRAYRSKVGASKGYTRPRIEIDEVRSMIRSHVGGRAILLG